MSTAEPAFDELERGHVVLAPDPFKPDSDATGPWVVVNNERRRSTSSSTSSWD
jgi:hypothetical protein